MSGSARFELVEGATFQLPDGSSVTVRDGQLELSDGRKLPMPAAGEAITVERTVSRPDGGTTRIRHTIRLSDTEPIVETPPRPFAGAGPGEGEKDVNGESKEAGETVPAPVASVAVEAAPAKPEDEKDSGPADQKQSPDLISDSQMPEAPTKEPTSEVAAGNVSVTPADHTLMGVNCGRRSLRDMLWGSIPESGFGEDEDEPKAPPKGLLNKSYSIKEEDESEHEDSDGAHEEVVGSSENADESFEFVDGKGKDAETGKESEKPKESEAAKEPQDRKEDKTEENEGDSKNKASEKEEPRAEAEPEKLEGVLTEPVHDDSSTKLPVVTFNTSSSESAPLKVDDADKEPSASCADQPSSADKPEIRDEPAQESAPESPSTEILAEQAAAVMATTASIDQPSEPQQEKPQLTRQEKLPSSGNLMAQAADDIVVRVGIPLVDAAPASKPVEAAPAHIDSNEESTASPSSDGAVPAVPLSDEVTHDLHLKLTPILRSLETDEPKNAAADDGERAPKSAPSEDRKGTVPPNTPAVVEDRECLPGADEPEPEEEPVSVPKVVSYYESISPRESPAPSRSRDSETAAVPKRDSETTAVPKVIKFAVPMEPEKIYLGGQEPEEMEDTPIPHPGQEQPARVELAPEPAALQQQQQQPQVLIPVRGAADDLDPLSALLVTDTATQPPSAPEEKSDGPATPSTTPEKEAVPEPTQDAAQNTVPAETDKSAPRVYNPELFEPEPKRPLILTSEMVDEDAPPYEPGVHDSQTLPMARKTVVVTEQPPPFGDDDRSDPRDPFLPDNPRPGTGIKDDGFLATCFDLCCCCWAP